MKKLTALLTAIVLAAGLLASCGASSRDESAENYGSVGAVTPGSTGDAAYDEAPSVNDSYPDSTGEGSDGLGVGVAQKQYDFAEKMIYSAEVNIETIKFDESVETIYSLADRYGAFIESSRVSGTSYASERSGRGSYRSANFVIRVPAAHFNTMRGSLESVGNVLNSYVYSTNITTQYYDSQSRLNAYRTEEERLMDMLSKCETVPDMLDIESRLSEVRYEIEALETTLRNWQNEVDYSTLEIYLSEVEDYTEKVEVNRTYWQKMGDGFRSSLKSVGAFFKSALMTLVVALPQIAVAAALIGVIVLAAVIIRRRVRRRVTEEESSVVAELVDEKGEDEKK